MSSELSELQERYERLRLLYESSKTIYSTLESQKALELVLAEAMRFVGATGGAVALLNFTNGFLEVQVSRNALPEAANLKLRVGEGIAGRVARTGRPERLSDVTRDPRYKALRHGVRSLLAVPLEADGEVRGVLSVDSDRPDAFSAADQALLTEFGTQAARAIQNTWIYEQFRLKARLFESLVKVSRTINSTLSLEEALEVVVREARPLMGAKMASLMMLDETGEWLDLRARAGAGEAYLKKPRLSTDESLLGSVVRRRKPLQEINVQTSSRYQYPEVARREGLVSLLSVPLLLNRQAIGTLSVYTEKPYVFSNEEIQILSALAELSAIAIEKAQLYERIVDAEEQLRQKEKLSALGWLAAEVAHEIRNPLTVLKMLYHSLDLKFAEGDPRAKDAQIVSRKMDHLNKIVERMLDFARTSEPEFARVDLNELIGELALLVRHKLSHQEIQLVQRLQPDLPPILGDRTQLEQAFLNLILNAVEAMPAGGTLTIMTRVQRVPPGASLAARVEVEFADTGQGMKLPHNQRSLGRLLRTTKKRGTGVGLAIVNRVVESHRGQLKMRTQAGRGTSVTVALPPK